MHTPQEFTERLQNQTREIAEVIAVRISLRCLPFIWVSQSPELLLAAVRAIYIASVNRAYPDYDVTPASYSAELHLGLFPNSLDQAHNAKEAAVHAVAAVYAANAEPYAKATAFYGQLLYPDRNGAHLSDLYWVEQNIPDTSSTVVAQQLMDKPLWPNGMPEDFAARWQGMKADLLRLEADWDLWVDLYENRLSGRPYAFSLLPVRGSEVVAQIAAADKDFWERPPADVNADIKARLLAAKVEVQESLEASIIPEQKRAPLETFIREGRIARSPPEPPHPVVDAREARRRSGREALIESLDDFQEAFPKHNHPGLVQSLARLRNALGSGIEDMDLIRAAIAAERVQQFAARADEVCSSEMAAEIVSLNITLQQQLAHFDEVRSYRDELKNDPVVSADIQAAELQIAQTLIGHEALEAETSDMLQELMEDAREEGSGDNDSLIYHGFERSLENTLATAARDALAHHKRLLKEGYDKGVIESGKLWTLSLFYGLPTAAVTALATHWGWFAAFLKFLETIT